MAGASDWLVCLAESKPVRILIKDLNMASGTESAPTAGEYIVHHLTHLTSTGHKQEAVIDWSVFNLDSIFWSLVMGGLAIFLLWRAASKATAGVPGRFQAAVEILEAVGQEAIGKRCLINFRHLLMI